MISMLGRGKSEEVEMLFLLIILCGDKHGFQLWSQQEQGQCTFEIEVVSRVCVGGGIKSSCGCSTVKPPTHRNQQWA